jgi:hypothetical protein
MTWGAYEAQNPSEASIWQHPVSENDISVICIPAGQIAFDPASEWRPQQDSNLRSRLRRRQTTSFEFVHPACSDSIAHVPDG